MRIDEDLDLLIVDDVSPSVPGGSDPTGDHYEDARLAVRFLARQGRGHEDRVALVQFAGSARVALQLTSLAGNLDVIEMALAPVSLPGGTEFAPALEETARLLEPERPGRRRSVALLSDGEPSGGRSEETFGRIARAVDRLGDIPVHLVALNADGTFDRVAERWTQLGLASITRLDRSEPGVLERTLGRVVVSELGLTWGGHDDPWRGSGSGRPFTASATPGRSGPR